MPHTEFFAPWILKTKVYHAIVDTGCINTLVPLSFAKKYGRGYKNKSEITVGGRKYEATAYIFDNVKFGGFPIPKMLAFCAKYEGALRSSVLLGLNVLNHLDLSISRNRGTLAFNVDVWELTEEKKYPFTMYFDGKDLKPKYFSSLLSQ